MNVPLSDLPIKLNYSNSMSLHLEHIRPKLPCILILVEASGAILLLFSEANLHISNFLISTIGLSCRLFCLSNVETVSISFSWNEKLNRLYQCYLVY